jgi:hypothetical protein
MKMNKINEENVTLTKSNAKYGIVVMEKRRLAATLETPHIEAPTRDSIMPTDLSLMYIERLGFLYRL